MPYQRVVVKLIQTGSVTRYVVVLEVSRINRYVHEIQYGRMGLCVGCLGGYGLPMRTVVAHYMTGIRILRRPSSAGDYPYLALLGGYTVGNIDKRTFRLVTQSLSGGEPHDSFAVTAIPVTRSVLVMRAFVCVRSNATASQLPSPHPVIDQIGVPRGAEQTVFPKRIDTVVCQENILHGSL